MKLTFKYKNLDVAIDGCDIEQVKEVLNMFVDKTDYTTYNPPTTYWGGVKSYDTICYTDESGMPTSIRAI